MSVKETNLVTVTNTDITGDDFVRVVDGASSRKQTVSSFVDSIDPLLVAVGFNKGSENTPVTVSRHLVKSTANYVVSITNSVVLIDTAGGNINVTLPTAFDFFDTDKSAGLEITIKKITTDANKVVIIPTGVETIDGHTSLLLLGPELTSTTVISDGTNWHVIN